MDTANHTQLATLDVGDDHFVGVCECGWASPNVHGRHRAAEALRIHLILRAYGDAVPNPGDRPAA